MSTENNNLDRLQQLPVDETEAGLCTETCGVSACGHTGINQD